MNKNVLTKKIQINKKIIEKEIEGTIHLLNTQNSTIITLNETASFIWNQFVKKMNVKIIIENLCQNYKINKIHAQKDVKEFLSKLIEINILK